MRRSSNREMPSRLPATNMGQAPDPPGFRYYTRVKQGIAHEVHTLADFWGKRLDEREAEECRQLLVKLAEDRFVLSVVGQFKRGKSSLMNAITRRDILPVGALPLTSVITVLRYGPKAKLTILKNGMTQTEEVPVSKISEYVTEAGNPGNAKKVIRASLELPSRFLRRGLEFVDTPGIGSAIEANTATTYDFLPQSDAVVFVTSVETPLTLAETDFLESIRKHVRKIFFVVNKIDLVANGERQDVLEFISQTLKRHIGAEELKIFPVSSAAALASTLQGKRDEYEKSGVNALQEALSDFLVTEKRDVLFVSVMDKAIVLARKASRQMRLLKLAGEVGQISQKEIQEKTEALTGQFESLREARVRLLAQIRERTISSAHEKLSSDGDSLLVAKSRELAEKLDESLARSSWTLSCVMVRHFAEYVLQKLSLDLDAWAKQQTERLNPELLKTLGDECPRIEEELRRIPISAGEILEDGDVGNLDGFSDCRLPIDRVLTPPIDIKADWALDASKPQALLPVFVVRSRLQKRLLARIAFLIEACIYRINENLLREVHQAVNNIGAEMEKRASKIESSLTQALQGKRYVKGVEGRWRTVEINADKLAGEIETLAEIEKKLDYIRAQILKAETAPPDGTSKKEPTKPFFQAPEERETLEELIGRATGGQKEVDFAHDLDTRGCAVCNRMIEISSAFFANWQYALSTKDSAQRAYAGSLGFCPVHTWQLEAMASPQGLSIGFSTLLERLSADLSRIAATGKAKHCDSLRMLVQKPAHCEVCKLVRNAEKKYLNNLTGFLLTDEGRNVYAHSQGVCMRHLGLLISGMSDQEVARFLVDHAALHFFEISEDMRNYALKRDALRGDMLNQDEKDAYLRALIFTVGAKRVCLPLELGKET
jgi:GTP-binding protein EngB required for normal cell division